jgi:hypothetical protein
MDRLKTARLSSAQAAVLTQTNRPIPARRREKGDRQPWQRPSEKGDKVAKCGLDKVAKCGLDKVAKCGLIDSSRARCRHIFIDICLPFGYKHRISLTEGAFPEGMPQRRERAAVPAGGGCRSALGRLRVPGRPAQGPVRTERA